MRKMTPLKIIIIYFVSSQLWIYFTDLLVARIATSPEMFTRLSIVKGWLYVAVISLLLYWLISRYASERDRAEEAIRLAKEEWEQTFDAISDPVIMLDTGFHIVKANKAMADVLGVTPADCVGMTCYESVHRTKQPPHSCPHVKLIADGAAHTEEIYDQRLGGHNIVSVSPLIGADGVLRGAVHIIRNINDVKRAEHVLYKSEKRLREMTNCLGEGLYVMDNDGLVTFMNPEAERLLGWTEAELMGKKIHDIIHHRKTGGSCQSFAECPMHKVIETGERFVSLDEVFISKDGREFTVSLIAAPLMENGHIVASITSFHDISERTKLALEREKLILDLQKALVEIKTLHGILPICSHCKKIRDDKGAWQPMETYISGHTDSEFSHGYCPECAKKALEEVDEFKKKNKP